MKMIARSGQLDSSGCEIEINSPPKLIKEAFAFEITGSGVSGYRQNITYAEVMEKSICKAANGLPVVHDAFSNQEALDDRLSWLYDGELRLVRLLNPVVFEVGSRIFVQSWTGKETVKKITKESGRILSKEDRGVFF